MNRIVLLGRLTADPVLRTTTSSKSVCSFTIAVNRKFVKQGEQKQADFISCVAWNKTAETISKYFNKGEQICVDGSLRQRSYEDKDGNKRTTFEVVLDNFDFVADSGSKVDSGTKTDVNISVNDSDFEEVGDDEDLPF